MEGTFCYGRYPQHHYRVGGHKLRVGVYHWERDKPLPSAGNTNRSSKNVVKMLAP